MPIALVLYKITYIYTYIVFNKPQQDTPECALNFEVLIDKYDLTTFVILSNPFKPVLQVKLFQNLQCMQLQLLTIYCYLKFSSL